MMHLLSEIDLGILHILFAARTETLTKAFLVVTNLGDSKVIIIGAVLIGLFMIWYKRYADIAGLCASLGGSTIVILGLKYLVHRPRPDLEYQAYVEGPFYSFPSAHAGLSMAFYGFVVYLLLNCTPTPIRRAFAAILPFVIVLVAFSRLYLGVHYMSDVLAGLIIGGFFIWAGICARLYLLTKLDSRL